MIWPGLEGKAQEDDLQLWRQGFLPLQLQMAPHIPADHKQNNKNEKNDENEEN